jgi:hypothetical protein
MVSLGQSRLPTGVVVSVADDDDLVVPKANFDIDIFVLVVGIGVEANIRTEKKGVFGRVLNGFSKDSATGFEVSLNGVNKGCDCHCPWLDHVAESGAHDSVSPLGEGV